MKARIGIIGGAGVSTPRCSSQGTVRRTPVRTGLGRIQVGELKGVPVAFCPGTAAGRASSGPDHYRANIYAEQSAWNAFIPPCAVGSLQEEFKLGESSW